MKIKNSHILELLQQKKMKMEKYAYKSLTLNRIYKYKIRNINVTLAFVRKPSHINGLKTFFLRG